MSIWSMVRDVPTVATAPEALGGDAAVFLAPVFVVVAFEGAGAEVFAVVGVVAASAATAQAAQTTATATSTRGMRRFDQGWTAGFDRYGRGVRVWIIPWNGRRVGSAA